MKRLLLFAALLFSMTAMAQTSTGSKPDGTGSDSIDCRKNIAFFKTYVRSQNYQDAYSFWEKVYKTWPTATKDTYIDGAKILGWLIQNSKDQATKKKYFDELMQMYDKRIKYYGDDPRFGTDYVLGSKVSDYYRFLQGKADSNTAYGWLKPVVDQKKEACDPLALSLYLYSSMNRMLNNPKLKEDYVNDYVLVSDYLDKEIKAAQDNGNDGRVKYLQSLKTGADTGFASSGAASCEMLEKIYGPTIDQNKTNKEYLSKLIALLHKMKCDDSPLYGKAATYMYNIEPSAAAAIGLAHQAVVHKDYPTAMKYFQEAIKLSSTPEEKADGYYSMAGLAYQQKNFAKAREFCNQAMAVRPGFGSPLLLIAQMYAASAPSIYPDDPILQHVVYCLVVDKCIKAKSIDSSVTDEANKLINTYSKYYPKKEDVFMHPKLTVGQPFTIGGWIGETTTVRVQK